jgi:hypothetical protein
MRNKIVPLAIASGLAVLRLSLPLRYYYDPGPLFRFITSWSKIAHFIFVCRFPRFSLFNRQIRISCRNGSPGTDGVVPRVTAASRGSLPLEN